MPKIIPNKGTGQEFLPCPEGDHPTVCVDIIEKGMVTSNYDGEERTQAKVMFVFECHPVDSNETFLVFQTYTQSLHEKSTLRRHIKGWRGRDLSPDEEATGYDYDVLLGKPCLLTIEHNTSGGTTYANISLVRPLKGKTCEPAGTYRRSAKWGPQYPHVQEAKLARAVPAKVAPRPSQRPQPAPIPQAEYDNDGPAF